MLATPCISNPLLIPEKNNTRQVSATVPSPTLNDTVQVILNHFDILATVVALVSVRKLRFLGNRCIDPGHILWATPYPPYLQIIFSFFKIIFKFLHFFPFS